MQTDWTASEREIIKTDISNQEPICLFIKNDIKQKPECCFFFSLFEVISQLHCFVVDTNYLVLSPPPIRKIIWLKTTYPIDIKTVDYSRRAINRIFRFWSTSFRIRKTKRPSRTAGYCFFQYQVHEGKMNTTKVLSNDRNKLHHASYFFYQPHIRKYVFTTAGELLSLIISRIVILIRETSWALPIVPASSLT